MDWFKYRYSIDKVSKKYELETRFSLYKKFNENDVEAFIRRLDNDNIVRYNYKEHTVITSEKISRVRIYEGDNKKYFTYKYPVSREENKAYRVSLNYSIEEDVDNIDMVKVKYNKVKQTLIDFDTFIVDIKIKNSDTSIEVEHKFYDPKQINKDLTFVQQILYESKIIYTFDEYQNLTNRLYRNLNMPFFRAVSRPINLEFKDLQYGNLVGDPQITYSASIKADGVRVFLCILNRYIWKITNEGNTITKLEKSNFKHEFFVIEGELIDDKYYMYYDLMLLQNSNITNLYDRLAYLDNLIPDIKIKSYTTEKKPYYKIHTVDQFYSVNNNLIESEEYQNSDGLIYTPDNISYKEFSKNDIYKWKPRSMMTIDLYVDQEGVLSILEQNAITPFRPLIDGEPKIFTIDSRYALSVVEVLFDENYYPNVIRVRTDKSYSNSNYVAHRIFNLLISNIEEPTLLGDDIRLLRKYHNKIKRSLFKDALDNTTDEKVLLDIGSGRGGDITKWSNYKHIYSVEPNKDNYAEFYRRLDGLPLYKDKNNITTFNIGIEDFDITTIEKPNVVSSMLSLSLIDTHYILDILNYLDNGSMFIALLITSEATDALYEDIGNVKSGPVSIDFRNNNELFIDIEGTIVQNQIEIPKSVLNFQVNALAIGYYIKKLDITNKEKLLNTHERYLSPLYADLIMIKKELLSDSEIQEFIDNPSVRNDAKYYA